MKKPKLNTMNFILSLSLGCFISQHILVAQSIPIAPQFEVETSTNGKTAIHGYSGPIGPIVPPPNDPESIGVVGIGYSGVKGEAKAGQFGHGVWGVSKRHNSNGVFGTAIGNYAYGVKGESSSGYYGAGLFGKYIGTELGFGVHAVGQGTNVRAVFGVCTNTSTGYGGYFIGGYGVYISPRLGVQRTTPSYPIHVGTSSGNGNGAHVTGGGTWTNGSSRTFKENFQEVNPNMILEALSKLDISKWQYLDSDEGTHLGPVAEEFHEAFGLGHDEKYISTTDADGVALTAIQALYEKIKILEQTKQDQEKLLNQLTADTRIARRLKRLQ